MKKAPVRQFLFNPFVGYVFEKGNATKRIATYFPLIIAAASVVLAFLFDLFKS